MGARKTYTETVIEIRTAMEFIKKKVCNQEIIDKDQNKKIEKLLERIHSLDLKTTSINNFEEKLASIHKRIDTTKTDVKSIGKRLWYFVTSIGLLFLGLGIYFYRTAINLLNSIVIKP